MPERIALTLGVQGGASPVDLPELAAYAERAGYVQVWTEEANATDAVSVLAAATQTTRDIQLGTGIIPVFGRAPAVVAMEAATMQMLSGGRFRLGLGASSKAIASTWRGEPYVKPVTRLREYVHVIRSLLAGERVVFCGETVRLEGFRVDLDLPTPPPIHVAALGQHTLTLGGQLSDGVLLALMTPERVRACAATVAAAALECGRAPRDVDIAMRLMVVIDEPEDDVRPMVQRLLSFYLSSDVYRQSFLRQGFDEHIEQFRRRWDSGARKAASAGLPDELLRVAVVSGSAEDVRARIDEYRANGLQTPIVYPLTTAKKPAERLEQIRKGISALAPPSEGEEERSTGCHPEPQPHGPSRSR